MYKRQCLDGAARWYEEGLGTHPLVVQATANYEDEMDVLAPFFAERMDVDPAHKDWITPFSHLYQEYSDWCEASGEQKVSKQAFSGYMTDKLDLGTHKGPHGARCRCGVKIREKTEEQGGGTGGSKTAFF